MSKEDPEALREQAAELLAEAQRLENEAKSLEKLGPEILLAIAIHDTTCRSNHTDGCGWYYEDNQSFLMRGSTKNRYVRQAQKLIKLAEQQKIPVSVDHLIKLVKLMNEAAKVPC